MDAPNVQLKSPARRRRFERYVYAAVVFLIVGLAIDGLFGPHGMIATYRLKLQVEKTQQKVRTLQDENKVFADQVRKLKTQPSAIEHIAHEQMGLVKPGELVFKLPPKSPTTAPPTESTAPPVPNR
ncbi:MAG: septum formation initiator family protein [Acidobacteriota bacterium]|nr:septum formation initiator family protein [Acidobacteriota bacterium]